VTVPSAPDDWPAGPADEFARLAVELHGTPSIEETLETVAEYAVQALECQRAGIALILPGGTVEVAVVTDRVVDEILQWQLQVGDGPMLHALTKSVTVHIADPTTDTRWPLWNQLVTDRAVGSVLHVPLTIHTPLGVLSLIHDKPNSFTIDDEAVAHILARHASVAVAGARREAQLAQAIDGRKLVGQAMGILMERHDLTGDQAYSILRRYSQDTNIKLLDVAKSVIATRGSH
jgi:GAF domain-containing protein